MHILFVVFVEWSLTDSDALDIHNFDVIDDMNSLGLLCGLQCISCLNHIL